MSCRSLIWLVALAATAPAAEQVDFGYAFAPPHRMALAQPEASDKTLLDLAHGSLTLSWSYENLRNLPLAILKPPRTDWHVRLQPLVDGQAFPQSRWTRGEGILPLLDNLYTNDAGSVRLEAIGAATAAIARVTAHNRDTRPHRFSIASEVLSGWVAHNPSWIEPGRNPDALLACQLDRPDRILLFGVGAGAYPTDRMIMTMEWTLQPAETRIGWLVRPYEAYEAEIAVLRARDWQREFVNAAANWSGLLARATRLEIPDEAVSAAFYASLGDLFIMREPLAAGYVGTLCGSEGYRSTSPFEPSLAAIALDQTGFHNEAANGLRVHLDMQEPSGEWADPHGWAHHMWGAAGMKAWAAMEHYRLTGDRAYLAAVYPRLLANSRWQETQRARTRVPVGGERPPEWGLMPRGMGDGGLMHGKDYFGVFYPHNILAVFADRLAVEAATILGRSELPELRHIHQTALADLRASLEKGAIRESAFRWIPGSPNDGSGSRWGALYTLFPAGVLTPGDPLVTGTLRKIEETISPGGQPVHTGWMEDGAWVAISLDNLAETHLVLGNGDQAAAYLYSTLNHGTPLYTWCEERGLEPGAKKTSGDRQHLWTPLSVVRFLRDALVMEQDGYLHLAAGTARSWLVQGKAVGVREAPTHFGEVSYRMQSDVEHGLIRAEITPPARETPRGIILHVRHPKRATIRRVTLNGKPWKDFDPEKELIRLPPGQSPVHLEVHFE